MDPEFVKNVVIEALNHHGVIEATEDDLNELNIQDFCFDSLDEIEVIIELEERLGIPLEDDFISKANEKTMNEFIEIVQRLI